MKNSGYLKRALVSGILAVVFGVVLLGVNAALGAPSQNPPGDNIFPTFSGVNIKGPVQNPDTDEVNVNDSLAVSEDINLKKNLNVEGVIKNPSAITQIMAAYTASLPAVTVEGTLSLKKPGNLDVQGAIFNSKLHNNSLDLPLYIVDNVHTKGDVEIEGGLDIQGPITNSDSGGFEAVEFDSTVHIGLGPADPATLHVYGFSAFDDDVSVLGNVWANSFGDYEKVVVSKDLDGSKGLEQLTVSCPQDYVVVWCYPSASAWADVDYDGFINNMWGRDINFMGQYVWPNDPSSCTVYAGVEKDLSDPVSLGFNANALCYNPSEESFGGF